ncbi:hypothetical protein JOE23_002196, partial [Amphibacillus cookii]|nr:hypothetical protein [Amphibacillus cookii]
MRRIGIQSKYAQPSYKPMKSQSNEESVRNVLDQEFRVSEKMSVLVSDLTYVKV